VVKGRQAGGACPFTNIVSDVRKVGGKVCAKRKIPIGACALQRAHRRAKVRYRQVSKTTVTYIATQCGYELLNTQEKKKKKMSYLGQVWHVQH
jgi:hypothetical protein